MTREFLRVEWLKIGVGTGGSHDPSIDDVRFDVDAERPRTYGECRQSGRVTGTPCPWAGCKHHLYLDVNPETGSIRINFPDLEPWEIHDPCAAELAERGGMTLEEVGDSMNITRERVRQIEVRALVGKLRPVAEETGLREGLHQPHTMTALAEMAEGVEPDVVPSSVSAIG